MRTPPRHASGMSRALAALTLCLAPAAARADLFQFQTLNNAADPTFNQLLAVNNAGVIAGYFGSGMAGHPNQGYTLAPPYTQGSYTNENFPGSVQTQVTGINNSGATVGFYADAAGDNFGFQHVNNTFSTILDPNLPTAATITEQVLGLNDHGLAAGFYVGADGNTHGFVYNMTAQTFTEVTIAGAVNVTATDVNNSGVVSGFYTAANGNTLGFLDDTNTKTITSVEAPGSTNTTLLGLNNEGQAVGTYVEANGLMHGLLYGVSGNTFQAVDDPNASPAIGTTVNGINDVGQLVGFYGDVAGNIDGMLVTNLSAVPEPSPLLLCLLAVPAFGASWAANALRARRNRPATEPAF